MTNYPRTLEQDGPHFLLTESIPSVYYAPEPRETALYQEGGAIPYEDVAEVAASLRMGRPIATYAFNRVFRELRAQAVRAGLVELWPSRYEGWDYLLSGDNVSKERRSHVLLATQAFHDIYRPLYLQRVKDRTKDISIVAAMFGWNEEAQSDRDLATQQLKRSED